jgi:uncharacterized protein (TIGR03435 family)
VADLGAISDSPRPSFAVVRVASIKPNKSGRQIVEFRIQPGGRLVATGVTINLLLQQAYGVKDFQISNAPPWLDVERYDIDAQPGASVGAAIANLSPTEASQHVMDMLKSLLAERCGLVLAHGTKDVSSYDLVVAKGGSKLRASTFKAPEKLEAIPTGTPQPGGIWLHGRGNLTSSGTNMPHFADTLSQFLGRKVVDKTGIKGLYDFTLQWTPADGEAGLLSKNYHEGESAPPPEPFGPSLFSAIREQLGLKLEANKVSADTLVIEHIEKPSDN